MEHFSADELSPLIWAYVGDAVFELYIRTSFVTTRRGKLHEFHKITTSMVNAETQAEMLKKLMPFLNEKEKEIVNRGRNAKSKNIPKNVDPVTYRYSTAFETLLGYLYLTQQQDRLTQIMKKGLSFYQNMY